jgi:hypothetical protein
MTTKPKTRKAPAANGAGVDPVFGAIAEHKALSKETDRLEESFRAAKAKAEKKNGKWTPAPNSGEWPGHATTTPLYDRWNRAVDAREQGGMRMARTKPATVAGAAAMVDHARREIEAPSDGCRGAWVTIALKTAASALVRMETA